MDCVVTSASSRIKDKIKWLAHSGPRTGRGKGIDIFTGELDSDLPHIVLPEGLMWMSLTDGPELLAREGNVAVIQLPDRKFPGVFGQGDTLATIRQLFDGVVDPSGLPDEILEVRARLDELLSYYEAVLQERGIRRPY